MNRYYIYSCRCDLCGNVQDTVKPWKGIPICKKCRKPMQAPPSSPTPQLREGKP